MAAVAKERRRLINRLVVATGNKESFRIEQLMNQLRQEVQDVREEQPELIDYHLYDLTFSFQQDGILLQMEFRR